MIAVLAAPPRASAAAEACATTNGRAATVTDVDDRLDLTLANGTRLRLSGVEAPRATPGNPALAIMSRDRLRGWLVGREIEFVTVAEAPDRWGRLEARITAPSGEARLSVAEALLDAGLARALPEPGARACMAALLASEAGARAASLGLWRDPAYAVIRASDRAAFAGRGGEIVVVEGAVTGVGETRFRTYVNFGPIRTVDFALTLRPSALKLLETLGLRPADWREKRVRARGLLDTRIGPQIDIAEPSAIEILSGDRAPPQSRPVARR